MPVYEMLDANYTKFNPQTDEGFELDQRWFSEPKTQEQRTMIMRTSFKGTVLGTYERNMYDDSDFYAVVWDGEKLRRYEYGTTRFWTYGNSAVIDATADVIVDAEDWLTEYWFWGMLNERKHESANPTYGKTVKSTTTRGKNVGIVGIVKWRGPGYRQHSADRIGVKIEGYAKLRYLDVDKVEVIDVKDTDYEDLWESAKRRASKHNWVDAVYHE